MSRGVAQKLADYRREELGEDIFELARLGPAALATVDALVLAGIADTRGDAIHRAVDRFRELPAYEGSASTCSTPAGSRTSSRP